MAHLFFQFRMLLIFFLQLYLPTILILSSVIFMSIYMEIPISTYMRDPSSIMNVSPLTGVISNFGVLVWCATTIICLFTWTILRCLQKECFLKNFFLYFGSITLLLMFDDLLLFHEYILPKFLNLPEKFIYIGYGILIFLGGIIFKGIIQKTEYRILLLALGFFGLSLVVDIFQGSIEQLVGEWRILLEDGFKFFGIVSWFGYFSICSYYLLGKFILNRESNSLL